MILCPVCGTETTVIETRTSKQNARRRRACKRTSCGTTITTVEFVVPSGKRVAADAMLVRRADLVRILEIAGTALAEPPTMDTTGTND
jgi:transcriptional regulator NrdR family protein